MSKQIQEAYIVAATRLPVGKRNGMFRNARPDDMLAHAIRAVVAQAPGVDPTRIGDVIVGCAIPEAEQGMNVARIGALLAGLPNTVPGITINRFCSSGLQAVADAANQIRLGLADVMIAAGTESMTAMSNIMGNKVAANPAWFSDENIGIAYGMGLTAEKVAQQWGIGREAQDAFALASNQKACAAIAAGHFSAETTPYVIRESLPDLKSGQIKLRERTVEFDEGPRAGGVGVEHVARMHEPAEGGEVEGRQVGESAQEEGDVRSPDREDGGRVADQRRVDVDPEDASPERRQRLPDEVDLLFARLVPVDPPRRHQLADVVRRAEGAQPGDERVGRRPVVGVAVEEADDDRAVARRQVGCVD